jgi:DNA-binding beta-propeller fold protein YncE
MIAAVRSTRRNRATAGAPFAIAAFLAAVMLVVPRPAVAQGNATPAMSASAADRHSGGTGTIYVGTYSKKILVLDEATLTLRDSIPVSIGIPYSFFLSFSRQHFYVIDPFNEKIEILDIPTRKSLGQFTLSSGTSRVRISGVNVDPRERFAVLLTTTTTKRLDRYEIGRPVLVRYDLEKRTVTDTIPWPRGEERDFAGIIFSPNGEFMYFLTGDEILVYETRDLKQVDRWDYARTLFEEGMGRLNFGFPNDIYEEPGFYTGLFRINDPVNHRPQMGVARLDLMNRSVDFYSLGPSVGVNFSLAPDKKRAYGIHSETGNYQFWTFDLENRRVLGKTEFKGRPRMGFKVSSNGELLYIHTAGNTIDVYETATFRHLRTVELAADMTGLVLIPPRVPGS